MRQQSEHLDVNVQWAFWARGLVLFTLTFLSATVRADDAPSPWFTAAFVGYGGAFAETGGSNDDTSANGKALLYGAALGWRVRPWIAVHGGGWGAWVPNAVVKYDQSDREPGELRMQAFGPGVSFMAPWGGYVSSSGGAAWASGTYQGRYDPKGVSFTTELGYRANVSRHLQLGIGLAGGGYFGSEWTGGHGGLLLSVASH